MKRSDRLDAHHGLEPRRINRRGLNALGDQAQHILEWRQRERKRLLRQLSVRTIRRKWSAALVRAILDELYVEDEVVALLGLIDELPPRRYPQVLAVALAVRHSWRPDDLQDLAKRLHL